MPMISTGRSPEPNPAYQQGLASYFSPLEAAELSLSIAGQATFVDK